MKSTGKDKFGANEFYNRWTFRNMHVVCTFQSTENLRSKWPTPSENADFDGFRLIVPQS